MVGIPRKPVKPPQELVDHLGYDGAEEFIEKFEENVQHLNELTIEANEKIADYNDFVENAKRRVQEIHERGQAELARKNKEMIINYVVVGAICVGYVIWKWKSGK